MKELDERCTRELRLIARYGSALLSCYEGLFKPAAFWLPGHPVSDLVPALKPFRHATCSRTERKGEVRIPHCEQAP